MSDPAKTRSVRRALRWPGGVLALVLLYPLSIGPVWYLDNSSGFVLGNAYHWFYDPIWNLTEGTPLGKPFERYYWWWVKLKYPEMEQLRLDWEKQRAINRTGHSASRADP